MCIVYIYLYYLACEEELDDMDFLEDVVDMPNEIPLVINVGSVISFTESLRSDTLQSCPNFEGDIRMDFLFDWWDFFCLFSLLATFFEVSLLSMSGLTLFDSKFGVFITASAHTSKASLAPSYPHLLSIVSRSLCKLLLIHKYSSWYIILIDAEIFMINLLYLASYLSQHNLQLRFHNISPTPVRMMLAFFQLSPTLPTFLDRNVGLLDTRIKPHGADVFYWISDFEFLVSTYSLHCKGNQDPIFYSKVEIHQHLDMKETWSSHETENLNHRK